MRTVGGRGARGSRPPSRGRGSRTSRAAGLVGRRDPARRDPARRGSVRRDPARRDAARRNCDDGAIDLWHGFAAAERLLAWCLDRPDATAVVPHDDAPVPRGGAWSVAESSTFDQYTYTAPEFWAVWSL